MADLTNYAEEHICKWLLCETAPPSAPTTHYVALHTGDPGETGASNEITALSGYARELVDFTYVSDGAADNDAAVEFGPAGESWGTITHVSIWDALTGGNCLMKGALTTSQAVANGNEFTIPAADLDGAIQ